MGSPLSVRPQGSRGREDNGTLSPRLLFTLWRRNRDDKRAWRDFVHNHSLTVSVAPVGVREDGSVADHFVAEVIGNADVLALLKYHPLCCSWRLADTAYVPVTASGSASAADADKIGKKRQAVRTAFRVDRERSVSGRVASFLSHVFGVEASLALADQLPQWSYGELDDKAGSGSPNADKNCWEMFRLECVAWCDTRLTDASDPNELRYLALCVQRLLALAKDAVVAAPTPQELSVPFLQERFPSARVDA